MVYIPDLSKGNITKKFKNIKNYFKHENENEGTDPQNNANVDEKKKSQFLDKKKSNCVNECNKKNSTDKNNTVVVKRTYAEIIKDAIDRKKCELNQKLTFLREDRKKDNIKTDIVNDDQEIVDDKVKKNETKELVVKKTKSDTIVVPSQPSNTNVVPETVKEEQVDTTTDSGNFKKLSFPNFTGLMPSPNMGAIYDNFSTSIKNVKNGIKNMGQNIEIKKPDFVGLRKRLSSITKEGRQERFEKLAEEEYTSSTSDDLLPALNKFVKLKKKKVDTNAESSQREDNSKKRRKNRKDKKIPFVYLANLSVKDGKDLVSEEVYNKLHMNNKFTKGFFTDSKGKPLWCKKAGDQSVEESDDSSTDSGDICALVSDALLAYCDGNFQIAEQLPRAYTSDANGDLHEIVKNDHLYTMDCVINNTVRTFSKMEEYKKSVQSLECSKPGNTKINQMPLLKFAKEVKVVIYNRMNPSELAEPIEFIPLDVGPSKHFNNKVQ
ncbi:Hypothetical protein SRAE_2000057900 [Strongyloides ratti]|uniref:Uncharacterized protein n=1 Tax=Strongyloides ratti TaxID=34506 RepID=A0A090LEG3_STRRB|nr:Hypothetical protein SRAE_2000057900 [Strongyloides ratti]CEF65905.1 Hypothetical protein SRAE_2000057900 [Strongyloides ratti]